MDRRRYAITLTELVATVATLMVAVALLSPALGEVRRYGKDTICLQNLASIAQASIVYASTDPDEQAVPLHPIAGYYLNHNIPSPTVRNTLELCYGGKSGSGRHDGNPWFWGTAFGRGPAERPLNPVLYRGGFPNYAGQPYGNYGEADIIARWEADTTLDLAVYRCPSDGGYTTGPHFTAFREGGLSSYDFYGTSYQAIGMWVGYGPGSRLFSNTPLWHRLSDVVNPSEALYYQEHCARLAYWCVPQPANSDVDGYDELIKGWHGQDWEFNVSFVDGHADQIQIRGRENPLLGHYPWAVDWIEGYILWNNVIARGPGWQFDTLPVPPTKTELIWGEAGSTAPTGDGEAGPLRVVPLP